VLRSLSMRWAALASFAALSAALVAILSVSSPSPAPRPAVSVAYLGDRAVASLVRAPRAGGWSISLRFRRHYSTSLGPPCLVPLGGPPVSAFTVALDYRAETLLVWATSSGVFARVLPAAGASGAVGAPGPVFKLGSAPSAVEAAAVFSDDAHAIVAWRSAAAARSGPPVAGVELDILRVRASGPPPPSRRPVLLARFRDPPSIPSLSGSLRLLRLPSEAVRLTWPGLSGGRLVAYSSPVSLWRGAYATSVAPVSP
jgi:hypothetical protein